MKKIRINLVTDYTDSCCYRIVVAVLSFTECKIQEWQMANLHVIAIIELSRTRGQVETPFKKQYGNQVGEGKTISSAVGGKMLEGQRNNNVHFLQLWLQFCAHSYTSIFIFFNKHARDLITGLITLETNLTFEQ